MSNSTRWAPQHTQGLSIDEIRLMQTMHYAYFFLRGPKKTWGLIGNLLALNNFWIIAGLRDLPSPFYQ